MRYVSAEYVRNVVGATTYSALTGGFEESAEQHISAATALVVAHLARAGFTPGEIPPDDEVRAGGGVNVSTTDAHLLQLATVGVLVEGLYGRKGLRPRSALVQRSIETWKGLEAGRMALVDAQPTVRYARQGAVRPTTANELDDVEESFG